MVLERLLRNSRRHYHGNTAIFLGMEEMSLGIPIHGSITITKATT